MKTKFTLTAILCILLSAKIAAATVIGYVTCGPKLTWELTDDGTLTISGEGEMDSWYSKYDIPWFSSFCDIKTVVIESGVTSIGEYAFYGCSSLKSVTIPTSVTSIGNYAFYGCSILTSITIPEGVTSIGDGAFDTYINIYYLGDLRSWCEINFGGIWTSSAYLYIQGKLLTDLTIPNSITSIGNYTFTGCKSLKSVTIPKGVARIGNGAFYGCSSLTSVTIPEGVTSIGDGAFNRCLSLTSITIPEGVTSIGDGAFNRCRSLTSITIPEGVTSIGNGAFSECSSLTSVTIPESVTRIGEYAFWSCDNLQAVVLPGTQWPNIEERAFEDNVPLFTNADTIPERVNNYYNITHLRDAIKIKHVYNGEKAKLTLTHSIPGYRVTPEWGDIDLKIDAGEYELGEFKLWFTIEGHNDSVSALCRWPNYTIEQEIYWTQDLSEAMEVGCEIELKATASSGLDVKFTSNDESVVSVNKRAGVTTLTCMSGGEAIITAKQNGNKNYKAAPVVEKTIRVKTTTGLPTIESGITVVSNPGEIVVEGATAEEPLTVYDMQGHKVYSGQEKSIEVSGGKIYIVKIDGHHYKVFVP